jgi:hypothetical protein
LRNSKLRHLSHVSEADKMKQKQLTLDRRKDKCLTQQCKTG